MSRTIDERVVSMQFDNRQFESNVNTSLGTLDKLKQSLNLTGAAKGLENVSSAARGFDVSPLSNGIEAVKSKFSALEVMGVTALVNITNSAVNAGKRLASAFTIEPIKSGLEEYETQLNAVQTILANTESKGSTLEDVNKSLDTLNTYADKTIYNFTEMTRNIGTFTAAGVDLETSTNAIQGIANLAAVSGSTSTQASTAMYQLSQALASGRVALQDWNSVVNAGMGGQVFQDALKRTATTMGTNVDDLIKKYGSFRESLTKGEWLTTEVLTETLNQFAGAYSEAELIEQGYTEQQAKDIVKMAETATNAATKVKTFSQLINTLKEAAQSGWTQTWEIILGDFEEAKAMFTDISDVFGKIIGDSAEARNSMLQSWKDLGGRQDLLDTFWNIFNAISGIVQPIHQAFNEIFPPMTGEKLKNITGAIENFTSKLVLSTERAEKLKDVFKGVFSVLDMFKKALTAISKPIFELLGSNGVGSVFDMLLDAAANFGRFLTSLNSGFSLDSFSGSLSKVSSGISKALSLITTAFTKAGSVLPSVGGKISEILSSVGSALDKAFKFIVDNISVFDVFAGIAGGGLVALIGSLIGPIGKLGKTISEFCSENGLLDMLTNIPETLKNVFGDGKMSTMKENVVEVLGSLHDALDSFTTGLKVASIVGIAIAVRLLVNTFSDLSKLSAKDIGKSLVAIALTMKILNGGFKSLTSTLSDFKPKGVIKSSVSLILLAKAVNVLADAIVKLADLSWGEIARGLVGVGAGIVELGAGVRIIGATKIPISTSIALLALAESCKMLADALHIFATLSWAEIGRGLTAMGGALGELTAVTAILGKTSGFSSLLGSGSILVISKSLSDIADALHIFATLSWAEIGRGLTAMGGALAEVAIVCGGLGKIAGFSGIFASGSILLVVQGLDDISDALHDFATLSWGEIGRGLTAMGGALAELAITTGVLGKVIGYSSMFSSGTMLALIHGLDDISDALQNFAMLSWDEIGRGLTAMGGALTELTIVTGALSKIAGFSSLFGAGSILIVVQGLSDISDALQNFAMLSWDEIGRGLTAMGGALTEISVVTGALGKMAGFSSLFGAGSIMIVVQGLSDIADALKSFATLSWDEIGRGLTAMGGAFGEIAIACGSLGKIAGFSSLFGASSILIVVQGLSDISDAFTQFKDISWGDIARGLVGMGGAIGEVAVVCGTLGKLAGFSSLFGAGSIFIVSNGIVEFAKSFLEFKDVSWGDIARGLVGMGGAVAEIAVVCGALGKLTGFASLFGAGSIYIVSQGIVEIAEALNKFGQMSWEEISHGLTAMGAALGEVALGGVVNTLSGLGSLSISTVAEPLGDLADSVKKWAGVTVPEGLNEQLDGLSTGIKSFTFDGLGASVISTIAAPLGELADSVNKWGDVSVSSEVGTHLTNLANGIRAFNWLFNASWSLSTVSGPLGELADSVSKWKNIKVPDTLGEQLSKLGDGVKAFGGSIIAGWSLSTIAGPLGELADGVTKLSKLSIPKDLGEKLKTFGTDISSFASKISTITGIDTTSIGAFANSVSSLSTSVKSISGIKVSNIDSLIDSLTKLSAVKIDASSLTESTSKVASAIKSMMETVNKTISSNSSTMKSSMVKAMEGVTAAVKSSSSSVKSATSNIMRDVSDSIKSKKSSVTSSAKSVADDAANAIKTKKSSFESAGKDLGAGLVIGIKAKEDAVYSAGYALGQKAVQGEKDGQKSKSPSKLTIQAGKWFGEGLVIGIDKMGSKVYNAGYNLGDTAVKSMSGVISRISDIVDSDIDAQPTIAPVLDLSNIESGASAIGGLLTGTTYGLNANLSAITGMMNERRQNGTTDDVISAINDLNRKISKMPVNSYTVNGITYDDGSNISDAVSALVRAARVERRV